MYLIVFFLINLFVGTFDFRLPDSDMLLPTGGGTNEAHVEDMETDTGDNDQCKYNALCTCIDIASAPISNSTDCN